MKESEIQLAKKVITKYQGPSKKFSRRTSEMSFGTIESEKIVEEMSYEDIKSMAITILQTKSGNHRKITDLKILSAFTRTIRYFKEHEIERSYEAQRLLCKKLLYGIYQPQQLIYEKGQESNRFYVVLSGAVQIFMPYSQKVVLEDGVEAFETIEEEMAILKEGDQFGEVGLLKGTQRNASARTLDQCEFCILEKQDFASIFAKIQSALIQQKLEFIRTIPIFKELTAGTLEYVIYNFSKVNFVQNQTVFHEGDNSDYVYAIREGIFRITKNFIIPRSTLVMTNQTEQIDSLNQQPIKKEFQIALITSGELLCEIDCLLNEKSHFSAYCDSLTGELLKIDRINFLRRLQDQNQNPEIERFLNNYIEEKIAWRNDKINEIKQVIFKKQEYVAGIFSNKAAFKLNSNKKLQTISLQKYKNNFKESNPIPTTLNLTSEKIDIKQQQSLEKKQQTIQFPNSRSNTLTIPSLSNIRKRVSRAQTQIGQYPTNTLPAQEQEPKAPVKSIVKNKISKQNIDNLQNQLEIISQSKKQFKHKNKVLYTEPNSHASPEVLSKLQNTQAYYGEQIKQFKQDINVQNETQEYGQVTKLPQIDQQQQNILQNINHQSILKQSIQHRYDSRLKPKELTFIVEKKVFNTQTNNKLNAFQKIAHDSSQLNSNAAVVQDFGWIHGTMPIYALKKLNLIKPIKYNVYDWRLKGHGKPIQGNLNKSDIINDQKIKEEDKNDKYPFSQLDQTTTQNQIVNYGPTNDLQLQDLHYNQQDILALKRGQIEDISLPDRVKYQKVSFEQLFQNEHEYEYVNLLMHQKQGNEKQPTLFQQ